MMGLFKSLAGMVTLELTSADIGALLSALNTQGIPVFDVRISGDLSAEICIYRRHYRRMAKLARRRGDSIRILHRWWVYWTAKGLLRRPVLVLGMSLLRFLRLFRHSRLLFGRVWANQTIPDNRVRSAALNCDVGFGAFRLKV